MAELRGFEGALARMLRNEGYWFMRLGSMIERGDATARQVGAVLQSSLKRVGVEVEGLPDGGAEGGDAPASPAGGVRFPGCRENQRKAWDESQIADCKISDLQIKLKQLLAVSSLATFRSQICKINSQISPP